MKRFGIRNKVGHTAGEIAVWFIVLLFEGGLTIEVVNKVEKLNTEITFRHRTSTRFLDTL